MPSKRVQPDPSWPRRPPGGQWGDPAAPKYYQGPPEWSPWNVDFNWRHQITKENERHIREQKELAERLASGDATTTAVEIESAKRIFGDSNLLTKLGQRQDPDHKGLSIQPKALEAALCKELRGMSKQVSEAAKQLARDQQARVEAELRATVAAAERAKAAHELQHLKRTVGDLRKLGRQPSHVLKSAGKQLGKSASQPVVGNTAGRTSVRSQRRRESARRTARSERRPQTGMVSARESQYTSRSRMSTARSGAESVYSDTSSVISGVSRASRSSRGSRASSRISSGSKFRTPRSWRGKTLDQLLEEKRAQRTARASARAAGNAGASQGLPKLPAFMPEE